MVFEVAIAFALGLAVFTIYYFAQKYMRRTKHENQHDKARRTNHENQKDLIEQKRLQDLNRKKWDLSDPVNQLRFVSQSEFYVERPINKEAFNTVYSVVEETLTQISPRHRLLAEVALGSFIKTSPRSGTKWTRERAFKSINSKRLDFLVINQFGKPALAIEYHGSGHRQGNSHDRDQVKKLALERANIPLLELTQGVLPEEVRSLVTERLSQQTKPSHSIAPQTTTTHST